MSLFLLLYIVGTELLPPQCFFSVAICRSSNNILLETLYHSVPSNFPSLSFIKSKFSAEKQYIPRLFEEVYAGLDIFNKSVCTKEIIVSILLLAGVSLMVLPLR